MDNNMIINTSSTSKVYNAIHYITDWWISTIDTSFSDIINNRKELTFFSKDAPNIWWL